MAAPKEKTHTPRVQPSLKEWQGSSLDDDNPIVFWVVAESQGHYGLTSSPKRHALPPINMEPDKRGSLFATGFLFKGPANVRFVTWWEPRDLVWNWWLGFGFDPPCILRICFDGKLPNLTNPNHQFKPPIRGKPKGAYPAAPRCDVAAPATPTQTRKQKKKNLLRPEVEDQWEHNLTSPPANHHQSGGRAETRSSSREVGVRVPLFCL